MPRCSCAILAAAGSSFGFRPAEEASDPETFATQALSVIGTDEKGQGPQMTVGFKDAYSSGGQIIRVLSLKERAGQDEATRTEGRWG